jgi:branched-chain amino acid transport system ATP-binding protein
MTPAPGSVVSPPVTAPILSVNELGKRFGGLDAVKGLTFDVRRAEATGIIGPNGAGKTTAFNCISGLLRPTAGSVVFDGADITRRSPEKRLEEGIARTFQNIRLFHHLTVLENVMVGAHSRSKGGLVSTVLLPWVDLRRRRAVEDTAAAALTEAGVPVEFWHRWPASLPYAAQRQVEIARAVVSEPKLLLLDEPAAGMISNETDRLQHVVRGLVGAGISVLIIEHDVSLIMSLCSRVVVMNFGCKIAEGTPDEIRNDQQVIEAYLGTDA